MTVSELITAFRIETEDLIPAVNLKYYFNGGTPNYTPYASTTEALTVIGSNWKPYMTVNVTGVDYWYLPNGSLVKKNESLVLADKAVTLPKMADMATASLMGRVTAGVGTPQVLTVAQVLTLLGLSTVLTDLSNKVAKADGYSLIATTELAKIHSKFAEDEASVIQSITDFNANLVLTDNNYTDEDKAKINDISQGLFTIILPASSTVAGRCVTPTEIPSGWTVSQSTSDQDLLITHTLTDRKIADVKVWSINAGGERLRVGGLAYVGLLANSATTLIIESLAAIEVPLRIEIFVK